MMKPSSISVLAASGLVVALTSACEHSDAGRGAQTTTTSASTPRPDATATTSHTIDNAGFVDNGGRTSDMTSRSEMSGMRATEAGSDRPTGTAGSGLALGRATSVAPSEQQFEAIGRIARARCDRETSCNRIGSGRAWKTQDSCVEGQRDVARVDLLSLGCAKGVDATQLGTCLNGLRGRSCADSTVALDGVAECRANAICAP